MLLGTFIYFIFFHIKSWRYYGLSICAPSNLCSMCHCFFLRSCQRDGTFTTIFCWWCCCWFHFRLDKDIYEMHGLVQICNDNNEYLLVPTRWSCLAKKKRNENKSKERNNEKNKTTIIHKNCTTIFEKIYIFTCA